ncbi:hypothetical protein AB3N04_06195 [Alkalihalophilus sp. As8PL]|uniref:Uncharacterized protein n=1 Tax=Alkalihalophilus sp. As8PL TaxID=3237103 RepID=A0AB39BWH8_9BACI
MENNTNYFEICGDRGSGDYQITEYINGEARLLYTVHGMKQGGLKEARQLIGRYLTKNHQPNNNQKYLHITKKPGRVNNPSHQWVIEEYLNGVPLSK